MLAISVNLKEFKRGLDDIARQQLPFAIAKTLTDLAKEAQLQIRSSIPKLFHVRSTWTEKGVRIEPARKADLISRGSCQSVVKDIDRHMLLQETGGIKRPTKSRRVAVPVPGFAQGARGAGGRIKATKMPAPLLHEFKGKRKPFLMKTSAGNSIIAQRIGKGRAVKALYALEPLVKIHARFGFAQTVVNVVHRKVNAVLAANLERATAMAKK